MTTIHRDGANQDYVEIPLPDGENIRFTYIRDSWVGTDAIRIQIQQTDGKLRPGPEIPVGVLGDAFSGIVNLLVRQRRDTTAD